MVPMSLWFVAYNQRRQPCGWCVAATDASVRAPGVVVMAVRSSACFYGAVDRFGGDSLRARNDATQTGRLISGKSITDTDIVLLWKSRRVTKVGRNVAQAGFAIGTGRAGIGWRRNRFARVSSAQLSGVGMGAPLGSSRRCVSGSGLSLSVVCCCCAGRVFSATGRGPGRRSFAGVPGKVWHGCGASSRRPRGRLTGPGQGIQLQ